MPIEDTRTWPVHRYDVPANLNYCAELLESEHTPTDFALAARVDAIPDDRSEAAADASLAQLSPERATTPVGRADALAEDDTAQVTRGAEIPGDDGEIGLMSVAEVLAMALAASATGSMVHAASVAPPPRAQSTGSSVAAAAPTATTYNIVASSAAAEAFQEAQLASGYEDPGSDTDEEAGSDGEAADDEKADGNISDDGGAPFAFSHLGGVQAYAFGAWLAYPMLAAGVYNGLVGATAPQTSAFALSPVVWPTAEVDESEASDDESD